MPINGEPMLDINIRNMQTVCDEVFVVCSNSNRHLFTNYKTLTIQSGYGCGDAVWRAIGKLIMLRGIIKKDDLCFIQWGDCFHDTSIYSVIKNAYNGKIVIPCVYENNPYVQIVPDEDSVKVLFSKYKEPITAGWHDLSLFFGNVCDLMIHLNDFQESIWSDELQKYTHQHGNEFTFLDVFNETPIKAEVLEIKNYTTKDFNTVEEYEQMISKL